MGLKLCWQSLIQVSRCFWQWLLNAPQHLVKANILHKLVLYLKTMQKNCPLKCFCFFKHLEYLIATWSLLIYALNFSSLKKLNLGVSYELRVFLGGRCYKWNVSCWWMLTFGMLKAFLGCFFFFPWMSCVNLFLWSLRGSEVYLILIHLCQISSGTFGLWSLHPQGDDCRVFF